MTGKPLFLENLMENPLLVFLEILFQLERIFMFLLPAIFRLKGENFKHKIILQKQR